MYVYLCEFLCVRACVCLCRGELPVWVLVYLSVGGSVYDRFMGRVFVYVCWFLRVCFSCAFV